jgi:hypothetical protein
MKIDLSSIDQLTFNVKERGDRILITPTKGKHVWTEEELKYRSLLTDKDGNVLSSGLEKFRNYGECPIDDEAFRLALGRNAVRFTEKMDGSLIILDWIEGAPHFRTRGSFDLGTFGPPVMELIHSKYPKLLPWFSSDQFLGDISRREYSLLFEYTAPTNRIVIKYEEPSLTLIGKMNKHTLVPVLDRTFLRVVSDMTGVPLVEAHVLPLDMAQLGPIVRGWQDKEGVVAEFVATSDGIFNTPRRVKIKASQYVRLHALKFKLSGNVAKLLFLLGATTSTTAREKLFDLGVDHEAQVFVQDEIDLYVSTYQRLRSQYQHFQQEVVARASWLKYNDIDPRAAKKSFVEIVRFWIKENDWPDAFFGAAMMLYDGSTTKAWVQAASLILIGESASTVMNWMNNPQVAVNDVLNVPTVDED